MRNQLINGSQLAPFWSTNFLLSFLTCMASPGRGTVNPRWVTYLRWKPHRGRREVKTQVLRMNYAHGTHVAGIAVRDNPAARLLVDCNH